MKRFKEGFKFEMWQSAGLRDMKRFRRENKKIMDEFSPVNEKTVKERLLVIYHNARGRVQSLVIKLAQKFKVKLPGSLELIIDSPKGEELKEKLEKVEKATKIWKEAPIPLDDNFFRTNDKKLDALVDATQKDMKVANRSILRKMDDVYRETIFKTQVFYNNGIVDMNKAVDMATKDFLRQGITSIKYSNGREVNIASYAEMRLEQPITGLI